MRYLHANAKKQHHPFSKSVRLIRTLIVTLCFAIASAGAFAGESLLDFNGKPSDIEVNLGKGKWLVVMLWASDCHVCNQEAHQYITFHQQHTEKDASVLGVSLDGAEKKADAEEFIKKHNVNGSSAEFVGKNH